MVYLGTENSQKTKSDHMADIILVFKEWQTLLYLQENM